jgi:hypothetical protein
MLTVGQSFRGSTFVRAVSCIIHLRNETPKTLRRRGHKAGYYIHADVCHGIEIDTPTYPIRSATVSQLRQDIRKTSVFGSQIP